MHRALVVLALVCASLAPASAANAIPVIEETVAAPPPDRITQLLHSQIGTWHCTLSYAGLKASETFVVNWAGFGDHYIRGTADLPAFRHEPPRKVDVVFGYDTAAKRWTNVFADSQGAYTMSSSPTGEPAKSLSLSNLYPVDPTIGTALVVLGPRTTTYDNSWSVSGVQRTSHEVCAKIPV